MSDEVYERIKKVCDFRASKWTNDCDKAMGTIFRQYQEIDIYNIYAPKCNVAQTSVASAVDEALKYSNHVKDKYFFQIRASASEIIRLLISPAL